MCQVSVPGTIPAVQRCRAAYSASRSPMTRTRQGMCLANHAGWEHRNFEGKPRPVDIDQLVTDDQAPRWIN